jgi:dTDP-4-amino-4,6-dideoxygalactose transaminase
MRPELPPAESITPAVGEMLRSGRLTKGLHLERFERLVAGHLRVKHAVAVSSCTTGLMLAYRGLQLEGEVVVPSFTFMATISSLVWAGLRPVFADACRATATLDVEAAERAITPNTSAIVAVHTFGNPAEIERLTQLADRYGLALLFDAAHGFGTLYQGCPVGPQGDAQVFSLSPTKLLVAGEGGIVATNNDELAHRVRLGREYGNDGSYDSLLIGINARLPEFNALLGCHSLELLEGAVTHRNRIATLYQRRLAGVGGVAGLRIGAGARCSYKDFSVLIDPVHFGLTRDHLAEALAADGVDTRKYYSPPVHRHTAYRQFADERTHLAGTEFLAERCLSLPMGAHMNEEVVDRIGAAIERIQQHAPEIRSLLRTSSIPKASAEIGHSMTWGASL